MAVLGLALQVMAEGGRILTSEKLQALNTLLATFQNRFGQDGLFFFLVASAVTCQLLRSGLKFAGDIAAAHLQASVEGDVRCQIFRQYMAISYDTAQDRKVGDLASHMEQVNYLGMAIQRVNITLSQILLLGAYSGVLLWLSWRATVVAATAMVLASLGLRRLVLRIRKYAGRFKRAIVTLGEQTIEFLSGLRLVHIFGRERFAIQQIDQTVAETVTNRRLGLVWQATLAPLIESFSILGVGAALIAGYLFFGTENPSELARLATFLIVLYRLAPRFSVINKNWGMINNYFPFVERISEFLRSDNKNYTVHRGEAFTGLKSEIEFRGVGKRYGDRGPWVLSDLSFRLRRGEMLAIVGESGAGKTTIISLLLRLHDPTVGSLLVDGVELERLDLSDWRLRLGVVSQDVFLLNTSVRDNIAFGKIDASDSEIKSAARAAHADEFISKLAQGYATPVGDQGLRLSGGQRQRLAIARAILRNPELLILDEATSDLDGRSERLIQDSISRLRANRTIIAVAHRLSTISMADRIIVLDKGQIREEGNHDELLAQGGLYTQFWQAQVLS